MQFIVFICLATGKEYEPLLLTVLYKGKGRRIFGSGLYFYHNIVFYIGGRFYKNNFFPLELARY